MITDRHWGIRACRRSPPPPPPTRLPPAALVVHAAALQTCSPSAWRSTRCRRAPGCSPTRRRRSCWHARLWRRCAPGCRSSTASCRSGAGRWAQRWPGPGHRPPAGRHGSQLCSWSVRTRQLQASLAAAAASSTPAPPPHLCTPGAGDCVGRGLRAHHHAAAGGRHLHPARGAGRRAVRRPGRCGCGGADPCEGGSRRRDASAAAGAPVPWHAAHGCATRPLACCPAPSHHAQPTCCCTTWMASWTSCACCRRVAVDGRAGGRAAAAAAAGRRRRPLAAAAATAAAAPAPPHQPAAAALHPTLLPAARPPAGQMLEARVLQAAAAAGAPAPDLEAVLQDSLARLHVVSPQFVAPRYWGQAAAGRGASRPAPLLQLSPLPLLQPWPDPPCLLPSPSNPTDPLRQLLPAAGLAAQPAPHAGRPGGACGGSRGGAWGGGGPGCRAPGLPAARQRGCLSLGGPGGAGGARAHGCVDVDPSASVRACRPGCTEQAAAAAAAAAAACSTRVLLLACALPDTRNSSSSRSRSRG